MTEETINQRQNETTLRNTFGWIRINILTMLIVNICLASFCFSSLIEGIQTFIHINHQDTMHYELYVLALGFMGLLLNGLCYLLIGGYTKEGNLCKIVRDFCSKYNIYLCVYNLMTKILL